MPSIQPAKGYATAMFVVLFLNLPLCFLLWGLLLLIPIGAWQLIDAIVRVLQGDTRRQLYLAVSGLYLLAFFLYGYFDLGLYQSTDIIVFFALAYAIGFWYAYITYRHACEEPDKITWSGESEILDEGL
jgi:hypothetical protein